MPESRNAARIAILIVGLVAVALVAMVVDGRSARSGGREMPWWTGAALDVAAPLQKAISTPVDVLHDLWADYVHLVGVREENDRLRSRIAELDEEYYLHFAGLKDKLELEPIYERHQDLTTLEWTQALGESVDGDRRVRELWRFACEGHLGNLTKEHSEKAAALETELEAEVDGEKIGFRMLRPTIANTEDRGKRERLDQARTQLTEEHLNPLYLDAVSIAQQAVPNSKYHNEVACA